MQSLYLQSPLILAELDEWVDKRLQNRERFSFTEEDVVSPIWKIGQEIRLREDSRFVPIKADFALTEPNDYWLLRHEKLANDALYNLLLDEDWDGQDLLTQLEIFDQQVSNSFHIFLPADSRFKLSEPRKGFYCLSLQQNLSLSELSVEHQSLLEKYTLNLVEDKIWTSSEMLMQFKTLGLPSEITTTMLETWLLKQPDWRRVGFDLWIKSEYLPKINPATSRYAVLPIGSSKSAIDYLTTQSEPVVDKNLPLKWSKSDADKVDAGQTDAFSWRIILRTHHLNEGIINVPLAARWLYPQALKLSKVVVLKGIWYEDADEMVLWLDRQNHKLFGVNLQAKLEVLLAGTILEITWTKLSLVLTLMGEDENVAQEEARLIDVASLAETRMIQLESYRASLRYLLAEGPANFNSLYTLICERQQHTINKNTIRSILSASREFTYHSLTKKWSLDPQINNEAGYKALRQITLLSSQRENQIEDIKLSELLQINLAKLKNLELIIPALDLGLEG